MPESNNKPLVSIIITSYNRGKYIDKAIRSALEQDYANLEIIISDNHSTDNTDEVVSKYIADKRIKYFVNETNIGMIPNFKLATEQRAKGVYISYISSDDYLCNPAFISGAIDLINKYENIVLVAGQSSTFYEDKNEMVENGMDYIYADEFRKGIDVFKLYPGRPSTSFSAVLMNREKLLLTKALDSKAQSLDYEANLKLMLTGNLAFMKARSYVWRMHTSQASGTMTFEKQVNNLDFIENTCDFARKQKIDIDIDQWRQRAFVNYLNGAARRLIKRKDEMVKLINYVKNEKKIKVSFFASPKIYLLLKMYLNYKTVGPVLKTIRPGLYRSIERDIS